MAIDGITDGLSATSILLLAVVCLVGYLKLSWIFDKTPKNLPPGPRGWGMTIRFVRASLNSTTHELAEEWAKQYGPLVYINVLGRKIAFLNSSDISRRIMGSDEFKLAVANRVPMAAPKIAWYNGKDIAFAKYDAIYKKKRRMLFHFLGVFGDGLEKFETVVWGEMERLFQELEQHEDEDYELWRSLSRSLKVIIYILTVGERPADPNIPDILEEFDIAFNNLWGPVNDFLLTNFPTLSKLCGKVRTAIDRLRKAQKAAEELVCHSPKKTHVPGSPRGIADLLFDMQKKPGNEWMDEDPEHVMAFLLTIFNAAHLTSRSTLLTVFLCLVNYPKVAKNIQEEVDRVLGDRLPRVEDRPNMPYTEATVLEVMRVVPQTPFSTVRVFTRDVY